MRVVIYKQVDHKDIEALINHTDLKEGEMIVDVDIRPMTDYVYINGNEMKRTLFLATVYIEEESI